MTHNGFFAVSNYSPHYVHIYNVSIVLVGLFAPSLNEYDNSYCFHQTNALMSPSACPKRQLFFVLCLNLIFLLLLVANMAR